MYQLAREINEDARNPSLVIGAIVTHPDGRRVKIVDGQYYGGPPGPFGGVSNFWYWREVQPDGSLSDTKEHGYGW